MRAIIENPADLGRVVRRLRESRGWTQRELAEGLGTSQRYVHELETGKPKRADAQFFAIIARLGITLTATTADNPAAPGTAATREVPTDG